MRCFACVARQQVAGVARALGPSLQAPAHGGSPSGVLPIKHNLQKLIKRGIAVNDATKTPSQVSHGVPLPY